MSRSHANPPRMQDQQDDVDSGQPEDISKALHAASNIPLGGQDPNVPLGDDQNEGTLDRDDEGEESTPNQRGKEERSWEQWFQDIQQDFSHVKEAVRVRAQSPWTL